MNVLDAYSFEDKGVTLEEQDGVYTVYKYENYGDRSGEQQFTDVDLARDYFNQLIQTLAS